MDETKDILTMKTRNTGTAMALALLLAGTAAIAQDREFRVEETSADDLVEAFAKQDECAFYLLAWSHGFDPSP